MMMAKPAQAVRVGPVAPQEPAVKHAPDEGRVFKGRDDRRLGAAIGLCQKCQAKGGDGAAGEHQRQVGRIGPDPAADKEGEAGMGGPRMGPVAEDRRQHKRPDKKDGIAPEGQRRCGFLSAKAAGGHHRHRIGRARGDRQKGRRVKQPLTGAHHDRHAAEPRHERGPAAKAHPLIQHGDGQDGDEQRRREIKRHRRGKGQCRKGKVIGGIGNEHRQPAQDHPPQSRCDQRAQTAIRPHQKKKEGKGRKAAEHHRLMQGVVARQPFEDEVLQRKDGDPADKIGDTACCVRGRGGGEGGAGHATWGCRKGRVRLGCRHGTAWPGATSSVGFVVQARKRKAILYFPYPATKCCRNRAVASQLTQVVNAP